MLELLSRHWWLVLLRGIAGIIFGLAAFAWPGLTLMALVLIFAIYALADGIAAIWLSFTEREGKGFWWEMLLVGIISLAAGFVTIGWPGITAVVLLFSIAAWAIVRGIFEIAAAIRLRKEIRNEWLLILTGVLSIIFGVALLTRPGVGALALVWLIGSYALVMGAVLTALSFRLLQVHRASTGRHHGTPA